MSILRGIVSTAPVASSTTTSHEVLGGNQRAVNVTLHEKARLLHMMVDPALSSKFQDWYSVLDRQELDDKDHRDDKRKAIADIFNNYDEHIYDNPTISFEVTGELKAALNHLTSFSYCKDINGT